MRRYFSTIQLMALVLTFFRAFSETISLYRTTGFMCEFAVPRQFEVSSWRKHISQLSGILSSAIEGDNLIYDEYSKRRETIKLTMEVIIAERSMWYTCDDSTRLEADYAIKICLDLIARMEKIYTGDPNATLSLIQFQVDTDTHQFLILSQESILESTRLSLLRHLYDHFWRKECSIVIEDNAAKLKRISKMIKADGLENTPSLIRLQARIKITTSIIDWLRPELMRLGDDNFVQEVLLNSMLFTIREIDSGLRSLEEIFLWPQRSSLITFAEKSEHLAGKFLFLKFRPSPIQKHVALGIMCVYKRLRNLRFYHLKSPNELLEKDPFQEGGTFAEYLAVQISFAKDVIGKLTIIILTNIIKSLNVEYDFQVLPALTREGLLITWRETANSVMDEYEEWELKTSLFSSKAYELYDKIIGLNEITGRFLVPSNGSRT